MTSDNTREEGDGQPPRAPRRRGCFFYGCLTVVLLTTGFIGLVAGVFYYGRSVVLPSLEEFLANIDRRDFREAYELFTPQTKANTRFEEFKRHFSSIADGLGEHRELHTRSVAISSTGGGIATVVVDAQYERGEAEITAVLVRMNGRWRIDQIKFNSPSLVQRCPRCDAENGPDAEFCKKCGKRLRPPEEEPQRRPGERVVKVEPWGRIGWTH